MQKTFFFVYKVKLLFAFLVVLFVPFDFENINVQTKITSFIFDNILVNIASNFDFLKIKNPEIISDSITFYILFVVLFFLAFIFTTLLSLVAAFKKNQLLFIKIIQLVLTYYLAIIMLKYGFAKFFKTQFYLPEPNILYTQVGMLDKDILFWTTMGTSYSYNVFMGLLEVVPALFLIYCRTRILGLLLLLGVLIHVVCVNFCFDISVKLYSFFLLFSCFLLILPFLKQISLFFLMQKSTVLLGFSGQDLINSKAIRLVLKTVVVCCIFTEVLLPYMLTKQINDEKAPRNELHGAYGVFKMVKTNKNVCDFDFKRIFIHKEYYFIIQHQDDSFEDFYLQINSQKHQFVMTDYDGDSIIFSYKYSAATKILELSSSDLGIILYSKLLPWRDLPLLQHLFHWTVDQI